jgi:uncharacterized protein YbjT (DUF2867 family)
MYVVTGATGHTGNLVAKRLLSAGKKVRVIGRSAERLGSLVSLGAEAAVADLTDEEAVANAFDGAEAAYVMVPPNQASNKYREYQDEVTEAAASAIEKNGVNHVVALSSFGADKSDKTGPIAGLHQLEERFKRISGLNVLFLRAGYFMENTLGQAAAIKQFGVTASPLKPELKIPMIATRDIGEFAADALLRLDFRGPQTQELLGQRDISMQEAATIIGKAIGQTDLRYRQLPDEQFRAVLVQMGFSEDVADLFLEMSAGLNSGHIRALEPRSARNTTPTSYEQFVEEDFVPVYRGSRAAA